MAPAVNLKSSLVLSIVCIITASLRATATAALLKPSSFSGAATAACAMCYRLSYADAASLALARVADQLASESGGAVRMPRQPSNIGSEIEEGCERCRWLAQLAEVGFTSEGIRQYADPHACGGPHAARPNRYRTFQPDPRRHENLRSGRSTERKAASRRTSRAFLPIMRDLHRNIELLDLLFQHPPAS